VTRRQHDRRRHHSRRLLAGDTYARIGADIGISADRCGKRAARLGVTSTAVLGRIEEGNRCRGAWQWTGELRRGNQHEL
jgi:hypothetical protein